MRGLGQIAELCAIARPDVGVITSDRPGAPRAARHGRARRARRRRRSSRRCPRAARRSCPDEPLLEPFLGRDDIEIRRFGPANVDVVRAIDAARASRRRRGDEARAGVPVHRAAPGAERARRARSPTRARPAAARGPGATSSSRAGAARSAAARRRAADQRLLQREPGLDARRARAPGRRAHGPATRRGARRRWPSSGPTRPRYHREVGELAADPRHRRRARPSATLARELRRRERRPTTPDEAVAEALKELVAARRRRPREGIARAWASRSSRKLSRECPPSGTSPRRGHLRDGRSRSSPGRSSSTSCAANEFGQHIREEGPADHHVKQGTPTMGGLLIVVSMIIPFLALSHYTEAGADGLLRHARLRRDRVHRRLVQGPAPPLARPQRPLEAPAAGRDHRRCRLVGERHRALDGHLCAGARLADRALLRLLRAPVPDHRGRGERREPDGRHRRARRRASG